MVFRLFVGTVGVAVAPAISSKTGLSIEYAVVELTGDFERFIFVKRFIRLTVVDDAEHVVESFFVVEFD